MLGRLPWLAFDRRMRAFFFLVFFDMGSQATAGSCRLHPGKKVVDRPRVDDTIEGHVAFRGAIATM